MNIRIRIIHNESNQGIAFSRNVALDNCRGDFIAIMDDDVASRRRLQLQVDYLNAHSDIDIIGGRFRTIDESGKIIAPVGMLYYNPDYIKARHLFKNVYGNGTVMLRYNVIAHLTGIKRYKKRNNEKKLWRRVTAQF